MDPWRFLDDLCRSSDDDVDRQSPAPPAQRAEPPAQRGVGHQRRGRGRPRGTPGNPEQRRALHEREALAAAERERVEAEARDVAVPPAVGVGVTCIQKFVCPVGLGFLHDVCGMIQVQNYANSGS